MFITFRRHYLDQMLEAESFAGEVLDVGGKKENPRGQFRPPKDKVSSWKYLSIDAETRPDFLSSADAIPAGNDQFDHVLLCEVAEHLEAPEKTLAECRRVLKAEGKMIMTMPFLYGVHADPQDFQRWTPAKIRFELSKAGFSDVEIRPMGGFFAVAADLYEMYCHLEFSRSGRIPVWMKGLRFLMRRVFLKPLMAVDQRFPFKDLLTTGYYVVAKK